MKRLKRYSYLKRKRYNNYRYSITSVSVNKVNLYRRKGNAKRDNISIKALSPILGKLIRSTNQIAYNSRG